MLGELKGEYKKFLFLVLFSFTIKGKYNLMSILFKTNGNVINNKISGGGSGEGFPPADIEILEIGTTTGVVSVKWKDPDNTVIDNTTLATWAGTILVRNDNHYPNSIDDGTIVVDSTSKNAYKESYFEDTGLTNDITYYYRFFPYSTEGVYNNSGNLVFKKTCGSIVDPVFSNNSWELINEIAESGKASDYWSVGDEITVTLSGTYIMDVILQIWDFNHYDKSDGSGKAGITLGCKGSVFTESMNFSSTNSGGWTKSRMSKTVMENIYNSMPSSLQNIIKMVSIGHDNGDIAGLISDNIFLPSLKETGKREAYEIIPATQFPIFTNNTSRIKKDNNGSGQAKVWWTRSSVTSGGYSFYSIGTDGNTTYSDFAASENGVVFCFNI